MMKRIALTFIFTMICAISFAQFQRMSIVKGTYRLSPKGKSSVKAYCQDYSRPAPHSGVKYNHVLTNPNDVSVIIGNETPITLQEAINKGYVSVSGKNFFSENTNNPDKAFSEILKYVDDAPGISKSDKTLLKLMLKIEWERTSIADKREFLSRAKEMGDYRSLELVNQTKQPVSVTVNNKTIVGSGSNPEGVKYLPQNDFPELGDDRLAQQKQWKEGTQTRQDVLQALGFYNGELTGEMDEATNMAVRRFKKERGVTVGENPQHEIFDEATEVELEKAVNESLDFFKDFGYYMEEINGDHQKLKTAISEFQLANGLPTTAKIDFDTKAKIDLIVRQRTENLYSLGYIDDINPHYQHLSEKVVQIGKSNGASTIREADAFLNETAQNTNHKIQNLAFGKSDQSLTENIKTVERYLGIEATGKFANIQAYIDNENALIKDINSIGLDKELIENSLESSKYYFIQNEVNRVVLKNNQKYWELVEVNLEKGIVVNRIKDSPAIKQFEDAINTKVINQSDNEIGFLYVNQTKLPDNKIKVQLGKREIVLTQEEFNSFLNGDAGTFFGASSQCPENIVVLRSTFEHNSTYDFNSFNKNANRTFKNNKKHVYFSSCWIRAKANLTSLPTIRKAEDVGICVSDNYQIKDYGVIKKVGKKLNRNKIESVSVGSNTKSNILIVTGHRDVEFKNYLNSLASSNTVKDKYVVLFSCYEDGIQAFNTNLISQGNAKAILFFPDKIHPNAVQAVLKEFNSMIEDGQLNRKADEILQESIDKAFNKVPGPLKKEVLKMKDAQIQLTFNHIFLELYNNIA